MTSSASSHRRRRLAGSLLAVAIVAPVATPPASADGALRYRYVANSNTGSDFFPIAETRLGATGDRWSLDGVTFVVKGSDFVLTVDDAAMASPLRVPVLVFDTRADGTRRVRYQCITNRQPVTIDVATRGSTVTLNIDNHTEAPWSGCRLGSAGTTGTLTVVP